MVAINRWGQLYGRRPGIYVWHRSIFSPIGFQSNDRTSSSLRPHLHPPDLDPAAPPHVPSARSLVATTPGSQRFRARLATLPLPLLPSCCTPPSHASNPTPTTVLLRRQQDTLHPKPSTSDSPTSHATVVSSPAPGRFRFGLADIPKSRCRSPRRPRLYLGAAPPLLP